jgi:hypothetical protein
MLTSTNLVNFNLNLEEGNTIFSDSRDVQNTSDIDIESLIMKGSDLKSNQFYRTTF